MVQACRELEPSLANLKSSDSLGIEADMLMLQADKEVKDVMAEFKAKYSLSKVGAQGFCWGGRYVVLLLGEPSRAWCASIDGTS